MLFLINKKKYWAVLSLQKKKKKNKNWAESTEFSNTPIPSYPHSQFPLLLTSDISVVYLL